ncbi:hypothetical protein EV663_101373 [Rhodovulum bhavnagarense]|uniref:Uncharacterized protein n=1 Tax=Rhodovulum bhavnagarense TaxID=992286 RepID=A0A4V2SWS1_9RHOB|nr:hypothetical protein EV663_101373 [Rhodovulum bhavnagarense]
MKKNSRWMTWIIAESAKPMPAMPWERRARGRGYRIRAAG